MTTEIAILIFSAITIGFFHTILGPDHYLPFIVMAKARNWSMIKTSWITVLCGIGHVGSSILLGSIGLAFGIGISKLAGLESFRGNLAGWAFVIFGLGYSIWAFWRMKKNRPHTHAHVHIDGTVHNHDHKHKGEHLHGHKKSLTPWILFLIFVLGPCEPFIPLLMYPAAKSSFAGMMAVTITFSFVTIATMLGVVLLTSYGISFARLGKMEKYTHVIAGLTILISGVGIQFLGL